ncbi:MAG: efflux RND transporter permease subunit [Treponema sp.]|nr:efflux RND transporter permease subunit [Treponema sp.]
MNISKKALSNPVLIIIVFTLLGIMGLFTLKKVEINLWPDLKEPYLMVYTRYENADPQSVENSITKIIEDGLVSVSNLKKITSISSEGTSIIELEFNYGVNLDAATNEVRDAIDSIRDYLPKNVKTPGIMKFTMNSMPIMTLAVRGNRNAEDLRYIADKEIKGILTQAAGVGQAIVSGGRKQIVRVELSQNRLAAFGLTVPQIASKLALENLDLGGGKIRDGYKNFVVRTSGEYSSVKEINDTVLKTINGYNVKLSDVGRAFFGYKDATESVYINGKPGVYISITKQSGTNAVKVADALYEKLEELKENLPGDIQIEVISDDSITIRETLNTLFSTAWQGILLAVLVLFIFLKSFKSTFIISISIPLSIIITFLLMHIFKITLNMMTLTGLILGVGMVVDASIVMIDNIYSYRVRGTRAKTAAILGSQEMISSVISGNLTTIVVFIPFLLYMKELDWMGQMAKDMIFTIVIAIVSSLFVAIFLVPVLAGHYLPLTNTTEKPVRNAVLKKLYDSFEKVIDKITEVYKKILYAALSHRKTTIFSAVAALFLSLALIPFLGIDLLPDTDAPSVTLNIEQPVGTNHDSTAKVVQYFSSLAQREVKKYKTIVASTGTAETGETSSENKGNVTIYLPYANKQIDSASDVKRKLEAHFAKFPGTKFSFRRGEMEEIEGPAIDIVVRGNDLAEASKFSKKLMKLMEQTGSLGTIGMDLKEGLPQVEVSIDRERAADFGVSIEAAAIEINNSIAGVTATKFRTNGNEYDVVLGYKNSDKEKVVDLDSIMVQGKDGLVRLSNFASLKKSFGPVEINRQNRTRSIHVTASITDGSKAPEVEAKIKKLVSENCVIPSALTVSYEGSWKKMQKQGSAFGQIIILAMILVFGVMAGTYGSFKAPFINMMTIPFMFIGVLVAYFLKGQPISIMTMLGLVMLVGIVVNNGIILVDYTNLLVSRGKSVREATFEAGTSRLRPVLMTTLTTILGMLPMSFVTTGSAAMVQPIGLGVLGGLLSSTFITLVLIPVLYSILMKDPVAEKSKIKMIELPSESEKTALEKQNEYNGKKADFRCEIIANQSVQEEITSLLEEKIEGFQYSVVEETFGRGLQSRKLGSSVWPEMNFVLTAYITKEELSVVTNVVESVKSIFHSEGIQMFAVTV